MADYHLESFGTFVGDGTTNDGPSFLLMAEAAKAAADTNPHFFLPAAPIRILGPPPIPGGTPSLGGRSIANWLKGFTACTVTGAGKLTTLLNPSGFQMFWGSGSSDTLPGSMPDRDFAWVQVHAVSSGAMSATLMDISHASRVTAGRWCALSACDLQGLYEGPYGSPSNLQFWEFKKTDTLVGAVVPFTTPVVDSHYLETFPRQNLGDGFHPASGGPAGLFMCNEFWDATMVFEDFSIENSTNQTLCGVRNVTWRRCRFTNIHGCIPSVVQKCVYEACEQPDATIEIDKFVEELIFDGGMCKAVACQSANGVMRLRNGFTTTGKMETTKRTYVNGCTLGTVTGGFASPGPSSYGRGDIFVIENSDVPLDFRAGGFLEHGNANDSTRNASEVYDLVAGVFSIPNGAFTTAVENVGWPKLTVTNPRNPSNSTATLIDGKYLLATVPGLTGALNNGVAAKVTITGPSTIELRDIPWPGGTWTGGGGVSPAQPPRWAPPGTRMFFENTGFGFTVLDVTQTVDRTLVTTDWTKFSGTWPDATPRDLQMCGPPVYGANNVGDWEVKDYNFPAAQGYPRMSYSNRVYCGHPGDLTSDRIQIGVSSSGVPSPPHRGSIIAVRITVLKRYTGTPPLTFQHNQFSNWPCKREDFTATSFGPLIDATVVGIRELVPATSLGWVGRVGTDDLKDLNVFYGTTNLYFNGTAANAPILSKDVSGENGSVGNGPVVRIETITDQGVRGPALDVGRMPLKFRVRAA